MLVVAVAGCSATRTLVAGRSAMRTRFGTLVAGHSAMRTRFETLVARRSATRTLDGIRGNKQFWSNLNCKFESFLAEKRTVGAVLD